MSLDQAQPSCHTVMTRYRNVVSLVRNIFIGDDAEIKRQNLKNYKSISDSITGKRRSNAWTYAGCSCR